jgi:hypothetical protein
MIAGESGNLGRFASKKSINQNAPRASPPHRAGH